jgi:hypothetical protein
LGRKTPEIYSRNIPEFSRMGSGEDRGSAFKSHDKQKREWRRVLRSFPSSEDSSPLPFLPAAGRTIPMTSFDAASRPFSRCHQTSGRLPPRRENRKSSSGSIMVEGWGGGGRSGGSQSLRCLRIFSMTLGLSMKLIIRRLPPHLGQVNGSARYTLRMRRVHARWQKRRKS